MYVLASVRMALRTLRVNKLRSALTMLGIIIGVGAVIAMVAVGSGAAARIQEQIASIGSNLLIVLPGAATSGGMRMGTGSTQTLSEDDARAIATEVPGVAAAAGLVGGDAQVVFGDQTWSTSAEGTTPEYLLIRDWDLSAGRFFTQQDMDAAATVAVLGQRVKQSLFGNEDPIGQIIRIQSAPFTVVGLLTSKGQSGFGQDQDDVVLIPLSTAKQRLFGVGPADARLVGTLEIKGAAREGLADLQQQVVELLRERHHLQPYQDNDFDVRNLVEIFAAEEEPSRSMALLLGAIASISLLVGGIGIMNIMLVSVTERTREIGLRMAVGARPRDILGQFLIEAVTLALIGGILGILLGVGASAVIAMLAHWSTLITPTSVAVAFGSAAFIGILFGYYPAHKAAFLDPIEALRHE